MMKKFHIRRSSKLCHVVCTMVPLSKSVRNCYIGLLKHLFYVLDENNVDIFFLVTKELTTAKKEKGKEIKQKQEAEKYTASS